ncbi:MAG: acyl-CoA dehydratase activase [Vulcanimicrobiaceae bacterium]
MIIAGVDIGSRHTKVVLVDRQGNVLAMYSSRTRPPLIELVDANIVFALDRIGAQRSDVGYVATTGFGRSSYPERDLQLTDVTSAAYGAMRAFPKTKCVIDIGAQSSRAMKLAPDGRVKEFKSNDKCAAGAGGFVERAAHYLEIPLEDVGHLSMNGEAPVTISSVCAVLAESEIINHVSQGESTENILRGVHDSLSERATLLLKRVGIEAEITLVGGMGNQDGMLRSLSDALTMPVNRPEHPESVNALGAALLGIRKLERSAA